MAIVKKRLRKDDYTTKIKLIEAILHIWIHDPEIKNICATLVHSMPNHVQCVTVAEKGHIKY